MRLIFVRHGHLDYGTDSLTELGHPQAEAAAHRLQNENITAIYSSSCGRAVQTAEHTAALLGLPVTQLDFMREIRWGKKNEAYSEYYHPWGAGQRMAKEGIDLLHYDFSEHPVWKGTYLEECTVFVRTELDKWLAGLGYEREGAVYRCTRENPDTIALFSHGGSSSAAMSHLLNVPMLYFCAIYTIDFTSVSIFDFDGKAGECVLPTMRLFNDHRHIRTDIPNVYC